MLAENDNLKDKVKSLRISMASQTTQSSVASKTEITRLNQVVQRITKERDDALKNVLLTRQLSQYFKFREHCVD